MKLLCGFAAVVLLATARTANATYVSTVLADNPVSYYQLNETSGTTAADSAPSAPVLNGNYNGSPTLAQQSAFPIQLGAAVQFDGSDDSVSVADDASLQLTGGFTLEAWVKPSSLSGTSRIISKRGSDNSGYGLGQTGNGKLLFTTFGHQDFQTTGTYLTLGSWTYVTVVFDSDFDAYFYTNGTLAEVVFGSSAATVNTSPLNIGRNPNSDSELWYGAIDEVAIYSTALSSSRIAEHYEAATLVPEPTIIILLGVGGLILYRQSRRRQFGRLPHRV